MAKELAPIECTTIDEVINAINHIASGCAHFKIGKTGENVQDRGNQEDYQDYDYIRSVFKTESQDLVSYLESYFIDRYIDHPRNDNKKDGDQSLKDSMAIASEYHLYVVWSIR